MTVRHLSRLFVSLAVMALLSTPAEAIPPPQGNEIGTVTSVRYGSNCTFGTDCIRGERYSLFFGSNRSWKVRIDPFGLVEAQLDLSFPSNRAAFSGVRYLGNFVQLGEPKLEDGVVRDIHATLNAAAGLQDILGQNVEYVELIFEDLNPTRDPFEVKFTTFADKNDFIEILDVQTGEQRRFEGPDAIIPSTGSFPPGEFDGGLGFGLLPGGRLGDDKLSYLYDPDTGEVALEFPDEVFLTAINIQSLSSRFDGSRPGVLDTEFDVHEPGVIFKDVAFGDRIDGEFVTFGTGPEQTHVLSFGTVAATGLLEVDVLADVKTYGALFGGGVSGVFDLVYDPPDLASMEGFAAQQGMVNTPEPSSILLALFGSAVVIGFGWWNRMTCRITNTDA